MTERVLWISVMVLADIYLFWTVLQAPGSGEISTKWGKLYKSEHPRRFWATFWLQFVMAVAVFPYLILRIIADKPIN